MNKAIATKNWSDPSYPCFYLDYESFEEAKEDIKRFTNQGYDVILQEEE